MQWIYCLFLILAVSADPFSKLKSDIENHRLQTKVVETDTLEGLRSYIAEKHINPQDIRALVVETHEAKTLAVEPKDAATQSLLSGEPHVIKQGTFEELRDYIVAQGGAFKTTEQYLQEVNLEAERTAKLQAVAAEANNVRSGTFEELRDYIIANGGQFQDQTKSQTIQAAGNQRVIKTGTYEELKEHLESMGVKIKTVQEYQHEQLAQKAEQPKLQAVAHKGTVVKTGTYEELKAHLEAQGIKLKTVQQYQHEQELAKKQLQEATANGNQGRVVKTGTYEELKEHLASLGVQVKTVQEYQQEQHAKQLQAVQHNQRILKTGTYDELKAHLESMGVQVKSVQEYQAQELQGAGTQLKAHLQGINSHPDTSRVVMRGSYDELKNYLLSQGGEFKDLSQYRAELLEKESQAQAEHNLQSVQAP